MAASADASQMKHWKNGVGYCSRNGSGVAIVMLSLGEVELQVQLVELTMVLEWLSKQGSSDHHACRAVCFEVRSFRPHTATNIGLADMQETYLIIEGLSSIMKRMPQILVAVADGIVPNLGVFLLGLCDVVFATPETTLALTETNMQIPLYFLWQMGPALTDYILSKGVCMGADDARHHGLVTATMSNLALQELQSNSFPQLLNLLLSLGVEHNAAGSIGSRRRGAPLIRETPLKVETGAGGLRSAMSKLIAVEETQRPSNEDISTTDGSESEGSSRNKVYQPPHPMSLPSSSLHACSGTAACNYQHNVNISFPQGADGLNPEPSPTKDITSVMIRNIPCRITAVELAEAVDNSGFRDLYDFLYMPKGNRRSKARESNLGYGFVNFPDPLNAQRFTREFSGYRFPGTKSAKKVEVRPSYLQGTMSMRTAHHDGDGDGVVLGIQEAIPDSLWSTQAFKEPPRRIAL
mmetsp:Transcript_54418/g.127017  ORF Transcript_54418/g.127017 Transcript_54418/m.127017 type:complete len:465 (+) Transcript_54418:68-1462(+)